MAIPARFRKGPEPRRHRPPRRRHAGAGHAGHGASPAAARRPEARPGDADHEGRAGGLDASAAGDERVGLNEVVVVNIHDADFDFQMTTDFELRILPKVDPWHCFLLRQFMLPSELSVF